MSIPERTHGGKFINSSPVADFSQNFDWGYVRLADLEVDRAYQRPHTRGRSITMANRWNTSLAGAIVVNVRENGRMYVIDGQHRVEAYNVMANAPESVWAQIFHGLTQQEEARLFNQLDTQRHGLTTGQDFRSLLVANDPTAIQIRDIASSLGLTTNANASASENNLRAFGTLFDIHRRRGPNGLERILRVASQSWPNSKYLGASSILRGLETFLDKYPEASNAHLVDALAKTTPMLIEANARTISGTLSSALSKATGQVIWAYYNKGLKKNRLPEW